MFRGWRLKKIHARFLEASRSLEGGRNYWLKSGGIGRRFLQFITPIPVLGLHQDGSLLLEALRWLEETRQQQPIREDVVCRYHRMIFKDDTLASGEYRRNHLNMGDNPLKPPPPEKVPALMKQLDIKLAQDQHRFDATNPLDEQAVLKSAVELHFRIGVIHPFHDANGRVARLAMNHLLRRYQFGYVIYPSLKDSPTFWDILKNSRGDNLNGLVEFAKTCMYRV